MKSELTPEGLGRAIQLLKDSSIREEEVCLDGHTEEFHRKLASIRQVSEVRPIEGADNIELAIIDGWQCIVKKGEIKAEQLCVYFEIDSFLPIRPEYEFLRKSSYKKMGDKEGFRLKTIRLRGEISQGLALGMDAVFPNYDYDYGLLLGLDNAIGFDLTGMLGVVKYDPPIPACIAGKVKGNFPSFIRKTDQERVQNIWNKIKPFDCSDAIEVATNPDATRGCAYEVTLKLDGTSCTYYLKDGVFGVCSRNLELKEDENNTLWKTARQYNVEELLREYGRNIALQGEIIGEGIQGNPEGIKGHQFFLFDIWDIDNQRYYTPDERLIVYFNNWCGKIQHVPLEQSDDDSISFFCERLDRFKSIKEILSFAEGPSLNPQTKREGLVFKSRSSGLTFKVISNQYLLKQG